MVITGHTLVKREGSTIPNYVKNVLTFKKLKPKDDEFLLATIAEENTPGDVLSDELKVKTEDYTIDFDKIIPEPRVKSECPKDCIVNKDSHIEADVERPWFDWYTWHNKYWDTKWNACDGYVINNKTSMTFVFSTAWSTPIPIFKKLVKLGFDIEIRYADEDYGENCGKLEYEQEDGRWKEYKYKYPNIFAKDLWERY